MKNVLAFVLIMAVLGQPTEQRAATPPETRAGAWTQSIVVSDGGNSGPRMLTSRGNESTSSNSEGYLSPPIKADFPFNALGAQWEGDFEPGEEINLELRASSDGETWSPWHPMRGIDQYLGAAPQATDLVFARGTYFQFRLYPVGMATMAGKIPQELTFTYIDSSQGPSLVEARSASSVAQSVAGAMAPAIIPRSAWGADETLRFNKGKEIWTPKYVPAKKITIHHTATANDDPNPAATVRAIYYYHAITQKWGDMGYNYIVDRYGNIYEGRYGGENVVGGHVYGYNEGNIGVAAMGTYGSVALPKDLEKSLISLLAWKTAQYGIDPLGSGFFVDKVLPNIMGHREANTTDCPGNNLFDYLPRVRAQVKGGLSPYYVSWIKHNTSRIMAPGRTVTISVTLRNAGTITWEPGGINAFRLGYKWYTMDGKPYRQSAAEDIRTSLIRKVAPGEEITLNALVVTPKNEGDYLLRWDMEQRFVAWFADKGSPPLEVAVKIMEPIYGVAWLAHNTPTTMVAGETALVNIEVENQGRAEWTPNGLQPFRIGYRWYASSGEQYVMSKYEDRRTALPRNVKPREKVQVTATLTAPNTPGTYMLNWDMVHEKVAWFSQQGEKTLAVLVQVLPPPLTVAPGAVAVLVESGGSPISRKISLIPEAGKPVSWSVIPPPLPGLTVEPQSGLAPAEITLEIDPSRMNPGTYLQNISLLVNPEGSRRYTIVMPITIIVAEESHRLFLPVWK